MQTKTENLARVEEFSCNLWKVMLENSHPKPMAHKALAELYQLTTEQKKFDTEKWHDGHFEIIMCISAYKERLLRKWWCLKNLLKISYLKLYYENLK